MRTENNYIRQGNWTTRLAWMFGLMMASCAMAADVNVSLSTREAYVGAPIQMEIRIDNAQSFEPPPLPVIDGVDIRALGAPSRNRQITIINGRRIERTSESLLYLLTPRREGTFEIPSLTLEVDGRSVKIEATTFKATKSETGDLLFVEIEGKKDRVYVGQPLELTLRIYLKPFRDLESSTTLTEGDMWRMFSKQTAWGSFSHRVRELQENNQRPGGREVLKDDGQGNERTYYLYELETQVYPTRPGALDASDVQIIVNYPTKLGRTRDPFGNFFSDDLFNSPLSQMMNDDIFGSAFGSRLAITATRPIVGEAKVGATRVLPVPEDGRPAGYRGAVGRYRIVTEATPTDVQAGDSITLSIGIVGTGPMELVQAPPLAEMASLSDFKVSNEPLAGFVRDDAKVFTTNIRPRREGVTEIPPITFSFFDPEREQFETVQSNPISITVSPAESLALDAIVSNRTQSLTFDDGAGVKTTVQVDFDNSSSLDVLRSQETATPFTWIRMALVFPPLLWLVIVVVTNYQWFVRYLPSLRSSQQNFRHAINRANSGEQILEALVCLINQTLKCRSNSVDWTAAVGSLRSVGDYSLAAEVESLASRLVTLEHRGEQENELDALKSMALAVGRRIDAEYPSGTRRGRRVLGAKGGRLMTKPGTYTLLILVFGFGGPIALGGDAFVQISGPNTAGIELSRVQQEEILAEASELYASAKLLAAEKDIEAAEKFGRAAAKYALLVSSGIQNSRLFLNLGNAYLQSDQLGRAIASYRRGICLDPDDQQIQANLRFAASAVAAVVDDEKLKASGNSSWFQGVLRAHEAVVNRLDRRIRPLLLATASLVFWGILVIRTCLARTSWAWLPFGRSALVPLMLGLLTAASLAVTEMRRPQHSPAVLVNDQVALRVGEGEQFEKVAQLENVDGQEVELLVERDGWVLVHTHGGQQGWIPNDCIERLPW